MKKDIFYGKIKKEYYSYILGYMFFYALLFVVGMVLCIFAYVLETQSKAHETRFLLCIFGIAGLIIGGGCFFSSLFVIYKFPKFPKLRGIWFNSDCYFADTTSDEYLGETITPRGRINKAAFDFVTTVAEAENKMGNKKPVRYTVYSALVLFSSVLGLVILFGMPLLYKNGIIFPNMSDGVFAFCWLFGCVVCIAFAVFFIDRAYNVAFDNHELISGLYTSLVDIAVRKSNMKHKLWYDKDQLAQIENLVKIYCVTAKLKIETKDNKPIKFTVVNKLNNRVVFKGYFL